VWIPRSSADVQEIFSPSCGSAMIDELPRATETGASSDEVLALLVLLDRLALDDQVDEGPGRSVHDRGLRGVHLDDHVVDAAAAERAQDVLDGVDLRVAGLDRRRPDQVGHVVHARLHLGRAAQVDAPENDPVVHGRRLEGEGHRLAGMEGVALDRHGARQGPLFHQFRKTVSATRARQRKRGESAASALTGTALPVGLILPRIKTPSRSAKTPCPQPTTFAKVR
jgi:hypothetical protein